MEVVEACGKGTFSTAEPSTRRSFPSTDDEVVGFEKDAESIMKKLAGGAKELDVISIFGMPGLGKTTLARKVYNNSSIVNHFDVKAWISVSQAYNRMKLLVEIFKQVTGDKREMKEDVDIADKLQKTLKGRRYLIVLDDIWEVDAWEDLGLCFPKGEDGSRVIVTTRIEEVAKHLQHRSDPYSLRFLTPEESWELLQKKVFQGESCPPDLQEAGLQVAKHCKGLPLVVVLIAGIIVKMEREASLWLEVANDLSCHVLGEQSMKVMQSSYDHLEDHLKSCLLYMAFFPEDHEILVSDLLKLWMAEEFVENIDTENIEETSRICLNDLLKRSLVMVSKRSFNGDTEYCTVHDVVREFCLAKLIEEKYMQLTMPYSPNRHVYSKESRLCIYIHDDLVKQLDHCEYQLDKIPMLESKLETKCFGDCPKPLEFIAHPVQFNTWNYYQSDPLPLLVKLRLVRVLRLMDADYLPSSWTTAVQSLTYLRYLEISVKEFDFKWISHLLDLQTLVVRSAICNPMTSLAIWRMSKLRHVNITKFSLVWEDDDRAVFEQSSTTMLENLKTFGMCCTYVDDMNPRFWWRFPNLEQLCLKIEDVPSRPLFPIPEIHTRLQSLELEVKNGRKGYNTSVGWDNYFVFPSNLRRLSIRNMSLTEKIVSNIASLRMLESLTLIRGSRFWNMNYCWDVTYVEFPALKYLTLNIRDLTEWKASEESFPMLEKLVIKGYCYLEEIPPCFVDVSTLQLIEVEDCMDSLGISAMNIKKEIEETTGCDSLQVRILED
ncbi:putative late blight resistance protein homolog R1B-23 [Nicotiana tomentosiformis]|uniref:putative late blight resistance protein homolog R1B-23 n=1 Tax=Nicotiana tomentosiformis TaxID=4098 RepID=UPI00051BDAB7|nr:putative late blight resistance protein homolog R1B-23 [Nicotiana tomentosiformis]XP_009596958.1 putative late blight resistance protein homolog R1B-23 [Nicotiana tomentosiformis]XP_009596959.1 putative late blight resistance protein homolog R1B-23 [Nicotiana tomentosiformis]XP_016442759.1 PREDICTED: putative late blight resistance protein homolog R1B-23 [Nicotiana tabacum]